MNRIPICLILISFCFLFHTTKSDEPVVKTALLSFMSKLNTITNLPPSWGWTSTSDPCTNGWKGVFCNNTSQVQMLFLDALNFRGIFDPSTICSVPALAESLSVISLNDNRLVVENFDAISSCKYLTRLYLRGNRFSGSLPDSFSSLSSLKILDISYNQFSGTLPDLARISLEDFLAQNNEFSGVLPNFRFAGFRRFNVSGNNLSGPIPYGGSLLPNTSFLDNPELCGDPSPNKCRSESVVPSSPQQPPPQEKKKRNNVVSRDQILMFSGYFAIALVAVFLIVFKFCRKAQKGQETVIDTKNKVAAVDESYLSIPTNVVLKEYKSSAIKSSSVTSVESGGGNASPSMVVLTSIDVSGLKFEDLLMAPAELLGRGNHGDVYKVKCEDLGVNLVVKRLNDWTISRNVFQVRMKRLDQVRHPNVLAPIAFYCSKEEKLVVYEYQPNGSLFKLLHGDQMEQVFDWSSRLGLAATTAKALAFMHQELRDDSMAHGNLKSSNILLNQNMEPCISEFGLIQEQDDQASFSSDVYAFGVILLEMLTGKVAVAKNNRMDLAKWVVSVVREEWTVEVFDRRLIIEGASEERMVMLLQVAIQCVNRMPAARPNIDQVAVMINTIKEEEEKSMDISESLNF